MIFFFASFFFCEIVDNVNTDWGELSEGKGFEGPFCDSILSQFSEQASNRNLGSRPIIKVLIVFRSVNGYMVKRNNQI